MTPATRAALRANLWKLLAFRVCFWMHFFAAVLVPFFTDWAGITLGQVFLLNAWFMVWNFLLEIPTGAVADRFGRKVSMALGALAFGAAALLFVSRRSWPVFLVAEVLFAVAYTLVSGADEALAYDTLVELDDASAAPRFLTRLGAAQLTGILAGALLGGPIAARFGLAAPMAWGAFPAFAALVIALTLHEPSRHRRDAARVPYHRLVVSGFACLRANAPLRALVIDMVTMNGVAWTLIWLYQPLVRAAGADPLWFGVLQAALVLGQIVVLQNATRLTALAGSPLGWLRLAGGLTGLLFLALGGVQWLPAVIALGVGAGAFGLTRPSLFAGYLNQHIAAANRATVLSTVSMLRTLVIVVGNVIIGPLAERSLHATVAGLGLVALALTAFAAATESDLAAVQE